MQAPIWRAVYQNSNPKLKSVAFDKRFDSLYDKAA